MSKTQTKIAEHKFIFGNKYENRLLSEYEMVEEGSPEVDNDGNPLKRVNSVSDHMSIDNMHKFAREGEADELILLIRQNPRKAKKHVNFVDAEKMSALHYAARFNHLECVKILVEEAAANVDVPNEEKVTPLHFAARYRRKARKTLDPGLRASMVDSMLLTDTTEEMNIRLIEEEKLPTVNNSVILYLVSKGANPNIQDTYGCTPLHYAAMRGNEVAAEQLLMLPEIAVEIEDNEMMTPLHLASAHNHFEIAQMLLDKTTSLFIQEESGCLPFHIACGEGNLNLTKLLISKAEERNQLTKMLNAIDRNSKTPLHYAVQDGHMDIAKLCLEKGANVNASTYGGKTALHLAALYGSVELVELLISFGANLSVINKVMQTPMHSAAEKNHVAVIEYLINLSADVESRDEDSFTPFLIAALHGHCESIKSLIDHKCELNVTEKSSKSALFLAVEHHYSEAVKTILDSENGKNLLHIPDVRGNYPLHMACKDGNVKIVRTLLDSGAIDDVKNEEERTPLHLAAKYGRTHIVKLLGERMKRSLITDEDEDSNTPLHLAAKSGYPKVIQLLINYGADKNARNCNKYSALDFAAAKGNWKAAQVLLQNGAQVDSMDKARVTPLYLACKNGHDSLVTLLLKHNADISTRISGDLSDPLTGCNPLDAAIDNGHRPCALAILKTDKWEIALRNQTKSLKGYVDTPMRKLIRKMPDVAEEVFKRCKVSNNKHPDHIDYAITYNFEFLEDSFASWGIKDYAEKVKKEVENDEESEVVSNAYDVASPDTYDENEKLAPSAMLYTADKKMIMNNHPLMVMVRKRREELLDHHIVSSLLRMKWNNFGILVYYSNLAIYLCYLLSLLVYMIEADPPFKYFLKNKAVGLNYSTCERVKEFIHNERLKHSAVISKYLVMVLTVVGLLKEAIQLFLNRAHYFSFENSMEWIMYVLAFVTVIDISACQTDIGIREEWQWQTGAVSSFMGIMNLVLFIRKVPFFGIYVVMFTDVLYTFIQFLPLFFLFIFAFAFAFYILLNNQLTFYSLLNSIIQTVVMTIGELEFENVFNSQYEINPVDNRIVFYDGVTYTIFGLFLLMMNIITMNLLVGLAVDDIKAVQEKATLERMGMQVMLALEVEGLVPEFIRRRYIIRKLIVYPNREYSFFKTMFGLGREVRRQMSKEDKMDDLELIKRQQKATADQLSDMKHKMRNLNSQTQLMTKMLTQIIKNLKVNFEEEDIQDDEDTDRN